MAKVLSPINMAFEEWFLKFRPISNARSEGGMSYDDVSFCFDTCGQDMVDVHEVLSCDPERVWTIVEVDGAWYLVNGYCRVNALYYVICEFPLTSNDFYEIPLDD